LQVYGSGVESEEEGKGGDEDTEKDGEDSAGVFSAGASSSAEDMQCFLVFATHFAIDPSKVEKTVQLQMAEFFFNNQRRALLK